MTAPSSPLRRQIGLFDATMVVMGGIVGSGIFVNPAVVAHRAPSATVALAVWVVGGLIAWIGATIYAQLSALRPEAGGQYVYLREAFHPLWGFLYGWALLLVIQTSAMAAVAMIFANYLGTVLGVALHPGVTASLVLGALVAINAIGVRAGTGVQSAVMVVKIAVVLLVLLAGFCAPFGLSTVAPVAEVSTFAWASALVPVMFAYGGWQTACFVSGEVRDPTRTMPRALILGVAGVIVLYVGVNLALLRVFSVEQLGAMGAPAASLLQAAWGERGARWLAIGVVFSTFGYLAQAMLTAPRVYFAMAQDRVFFRAMARVGRGGAPTAAIALQGLLAALIAFSGSYEKIIDYAIFADFFFIGLSAATVFALRRGHAGERLPRIPGDPLTTLAFTAVCWTVSLAAGINAGTNSLIGLALIAAGVPVFLIWRRRRAL